MSFTEVFRDSTIPRPILDDFTYFSGGAPEMVPLASRLHAGLVRHAIGEREELCIVTPTAKPEHLHLLALDALSAVTGRERDTVFVLSADTSVRERFRHLSPPEDEHSPSLPFSEAEYPIANVTPDGSLSSVTESSSGDTHPRFLFSYTSKRIPSETVGGRVACVIFDDSVKVTEDRLAKIRNWRSGNAVPTIIYLTSDPLSDLYDIVGPDAAIWTWPTELLRESLDADLRRRLGSPTLREDSSVSEDQLRIGGQLLNKVDGVRGEVNVPGGEEVEGLLGAVHDEQFNFEKLVHKLDSDVLWNARRSIRYAIREFEELLAPIELTEIHSSRRSISARLEQLDRYASTISSDPDGGPAVGTYRDVLSSLERLHESWPEIPERQKKEGQLVAHLMAIDDSGESVAVVTSTEAHTRAVATYLQAEYSALYSQLGDDLSIHGPDNVRRAMPADHVLLYGAPRYRQRDLLRLSISPHLVVLAYPTELRLLRSQVDSMNDAFERAIEQDSWEVAIDATKSACGERVSSPSPECVELAVPEPEGRSKSRLAAEVELREESEEADLADIVRTFDPDYQSPVDDSIGGGGDESAVGPERTITECVALFVAGGGTLYYRPTDEVSVLRAEHEKLLSKEAQDVTPGDVVLHFEGTDEMREKLYELIQDRGDAQLAFYAASWRVFLEQAIAKNDDNLDQFIERVNEHLSEDEYKTRQTYRRWYNLDVRRTRSRKSMEAIVAAYDLTFVDENFDAVWNAVHKMETLYKRLKEALAEHALRSVTSGEYEDVVVSDHPRIQLSDFDIEHHLHQCTISGKESREVPAYRIGTYDR